MLVLTSYNKPYLLENPNDPIVIKHFWGFSGSLFDFRLFPFTFLETTTGPVATLRINQFTFEVPCSIDSKQSWHIMIADPDTHQLDAIPILNIASQPCHTYLMSPTDSKIRLAEVELVDYSTAGSLTHPSIPNGAALCHPAGIDDTFGSDTQLTVIISPHDMSKFLNGKITGDLI